MDADNVEIECPVCDQKIRADAPRCPNCGIWTDMPRRSTSGPRQRR
jgi:hypothetical protein